MIDQNVFRYRLFKINTVCMVKDVTQQKSNNEATYSLDAKGNSHV
jgi:hypothetical protein